MKANIKLSTIGQAVIADDTPMPKLNSDLNLFLVWFFLFRSFVGSVVAWLERHDCDRYDLGSKPTSAIPLCPWEKYFTALSPTILLASCYKFCWQAVINCSISIKFKRTAISWHFRKQVRVIAYTLCQQFPNWAPRKLEKVFAFTAFLTKAAM